MNVRLLLVPAFVAVIGVVIWKSTPATGGPATTWRVGLGTDVRQGRNYDELDAETAIRLSCHCDEPRFYYVFSHSSEDGTLLLWPSPSLESDLGQPLPAGSHVLPGKLADREVAWHTRKGIQSVTTFVAIASRTKIDELEALLPKLRQWTNRVFPDRSMQVTVPLSGVAITGEPRTTKFPVELLQRAADLAITESLPNGPMQADARLSGVWLSSWKVVEKKGAQKDAAVELPKPVPEPDPKPNK